MQNGATLGEALESSLEDLDGFFTFVVGTEDGFGVVRILSLANQRLWQKLINMSPSAVNIGHW